MSELLLSLLIDLAKQHGPNIAKEVVILVRARGNKGQYERVCEILEKDPNTYFDN